MASATASRTPGLASDDYDGRPAAAGPRPMAVTSRQSRRRESRIEDSADCT